MAPAGSFHCQRLIDISGRGPGIGNVGDEGVSGLERLPCRILDSQVERFAGDQSFRWTGRYLSQPFLHRHVVRRARSHEAVGFAFRFDFDLLQARFFRGASVYAGEDQKSDESDGQRMFGHVSSASRASISKLIAPLKRPGLVFCVLDSTRDESALEHSALVARKCAGQSDRGPPGERLVSGTVSQAKPPRRLYRAGSLRLSFQSDEGTITGSALTKKRALVNLGISYAARYVGLGAGLAVFLLQRGREVKVEPHTELVLTFSRPVEISK